MAAGRRDAADRLLGRRQDLKPALEVAGIILVGEDVGAALIVAIVFDDAAVSEVFISELLLGPIVGAQLDQAGLLRGLPQPLRGLSVRLGDLQVERALRCGRGPHDVAGLAEHRKLGLARDVEALILDARVPDAREPDLVVLPLADTWPRHGFEHAGLAVRPPYHRPADAGVEVAHHQRVGEGLP